MLTKTQTLLSVALPFMPLMCLLQVTRGTRTRFPEDGSLLLIGQFEERNAELK